MKRNLVLIILITAAACIAFARTPVANLSSVQPVTVDGHTLSAPGVSSWPVMVGDDVRTSTAPATMSFQDGSRIQLAPQSQLKLAGSEAAPRVVLVAGNLEYKLAPGSPVSVSKEEAAGAPEPPNGAPQASAPAAMVVHSAKFYFLTGVLTAGAAAGVAGGVYHVVSSGNSLPANSNH